ncbi:MAG: alanine:cation symporter family protein [Oscillospiraceae bacterium]|nr:alanine:cation symporter family protein [Oscillospiraceae bacterium]
MLEKITGQISGILWSTPLVVFILAVGLIYSLRMKFPQLRLVKDQVKVLSSGKSSDAGISSFQGFAMVLGGRVGVGAIAGVATAIYYGGPGSIFWMWVAAILGASVTFGESTLGQLYKEKVGGEYSGGPAFYIKKGIKNKSFGKVLSMVYAFLTLMAVMMTGPSVQAFNIADSMNAAFGLRPILVGAVIALLFVLVTMGGAKRIGSVASVLVPVMGIAYIVLALIVLALNIKAIPAMFGLIFSSAFGKNAVYGGLIGSAMMWGIKRALYASDAGTGQGSHASSAAEVSHPIKQGLAESFSVYVVTIFICTATALMILSTNSFNVINEKTGVMITENLSGSGVGSAFVQAAINTVLPGAGAKFVAIAVLLFAFTTLMAFGVMIESNINYIVGEFKYRKVLVLIGRIICTAIIFFACISSAEVAWNLADIGVGLMAWSNLIAMVFLQNTVVRLLADYEKQKKLGLDPVFEPKDLGIEQAELWDEIARTAYRRQLEEKNKKMEANS